MRNSPPIVRATARRRPAAALIMAATFLAAPLAAQDQKRSAGDTYLAYLEAGARMRSVKDLKPFLPRELGNMLAKIPKDVQAEMIKQSRAKQVFRVRIVKESRLGDAYILEVEGARNRRPRKGWVKMIVADEIPVKGWVKMIVEDGEFKVLKDDWSGASPPAAPKIPASVSDAGKAVGEFTVNGKTAPLKYAFARAVPYSFDRTKVAYEVILSDAPWNPKEYNQMDRVKAGTLHFVTVTIGPDKAVAGTMLNHRELEKGMLSSAGGQHKFEAEKLGPDTVSGRAYMESPEEGLGQTYYYAATFKAAVEKPKRGAQ